MTDQIIETDLMRQLIEDEGFVSYVYEDSLGYLTIGIGRMVDKRKGGGITRNEALYLLQNDIDRVTKELKTTFSWFDNLSYNRRNVLINMCFNLGLSNLLKFKNTLSAIEMGDYKSAAQGMRNSLWYKQVGHRAERLARIMENF